MDTVAELARSLAVRAPELSDRLVDRINATDEVYRERQLVPPEDLWRSCHDNMVEILKALTQVTDVDEYDLDAPRATGRRRAEQGFPLENLLHAYRLAGPVIWEGLREEARAHTPPVDDELMDGAVVVWEIIDFYSDEVGRAYRQTERAILRRDETQRQTMMRSLLSGIVSPADLPHANEILGLPRSGPYMVAVADPQGDTSTSGRALGAALSVRSIPSEWLSSNDRLVGLIAPRRADAATVGRHLMASGSLRIGMSPPVDDLALVPGAYRQAELALRCIRPNRLEAVSLDDRLMPALLVASPELGRRLARNVLGGLLDLPPVERDLLLRTLRTYIDAGGSVSATAGLLFCHRNTVFRRIGAIQDLTGLSPADPRGVAQLALALEAQELLLADTD
jgi:hypothetical protein